MSDGEIFVRVAGALLCGALVGIERERKNRPAGFRTMILISLGSCGFILLTLEAVATVNDSVIKNWPAGTALPGQAEISRAIQGLMGGIGFLGAGAVIQNKRAVRGLTTAAAVWVVAALGAACGMGAYRLAMILGGATLFTLVILDVVENRFFPEPVDLVDGSKNGKADSANQIAQIEVVRDDGYGPARMRGEDAPGQ